MACFLITLNSATSPQLQWCLQLQMSHNGEIFMRQWSVGGGGGAKNQRDPPPFIQSERLQKARINHSINHSPFPQGHCLLFMITQLSVVCLIGGGGLTSRVAIFLIAKLWEKNIAQNYWTVFLILAYPMAESEMNNGVELFLRSTGM